MDGGIMKQKIFTLMLALFSLSAMGQKMSEKQYMELAKENFEALPKSIIDKDKNKDLIQLGEKLYFEKRLSVNDSISCNTCHQLDKYGVDNEPTSAGHEKKRGDRNSPTVYNAALHIDQFWDGRAKDVEEQALGPILNPVEMGMASDVDVVKKLKSIDEYADLFKKSFPKDKDPIVYKNIGKAIGAFERTLLTPSRFDDYLAGNEKALSQQEKIGMKRFVEIGCTSCHSGPAIGGGMYMKLGAINEYKTEDVGRFAVTKEEDDKHVFKVPSLRNIEKTAPYFHDGSIKTLDEAIKLMAYHQLDEKISNEDITLIKSFLSSLTAKKLPY